MNESESAGPPLNKDVHEGEPALPPVVPRAVGNANETPAYTRPAAHGDPSQIVEADGTSALELPDIVRALRHRDFRWFWAGNFLSNVGTWMQNVAQGWLVLHLTNSAFWLGLIGFASTIPILFFALIGGVIADHVNNRKLLMVTQSTMMLSAFIMAGLAYSNVIDRWGILLLAVLTGLAMALNTPSYQALVPQLVPREDLANSIALNSAQFNMSRVIGPTLGGLTMAMASRVLGPPHGGGDMATAGAAGNFFLNGLSFLAVIFVLTQIRYPARQAPPEGHLWEKLKQGFAYVFSHGHMAPLVVLVSITSLLAIPYLIFVPFFARDVLHTDEQGLGLLMACSGVGAFFGALTIAYVARIHNRGIFVVRAGTGFFASIILFTFSRNFLLSGLLLMAAGYCMIIMVATINVLLQHLAEDSMRGRAMSIYSTAFLGLPPIGSLIAGLLAKIITPPHAIAGMSALALAGSWLVLWKMQGLQSLD
jgi:MFS family permease